MSVKKMQRCTRAPPRNTARQALKENRQQKQMGTDVKMNRKAVIIAQEIKFTRLLSCNNKRIRDRLLKSFRKWLTVRSKSSFAFTEADFMRLWKGLFYCLWMSDKPLIQEELAESLSKIVHCFESIDVILLYTTCVLKTLGTEWYGIDQYRLDKFAMLVRRIIRQTFEVCKKKSWNIEWVKGVSGILEKVLLDPKVCIGLKMHMTEVFLEEFSKISGGDVTEDVVTELVKPFILFIVPMHDERHLRHVMTHIFRYLIFQSDTGMEFTEKFAAWRDAGFPGRFIDAMQKVELSDEELEDNDDDNDNDKKQFLENQMKSNTEKALDPRAGRVDVELPQIPFNPKEIATILIQYKFHPSSTTKSRRQLRRLINEFTELSQGRMPLGVHEVRMPSRNKKDTNTKIAAMRLLDLEGKLNSDNLQKKRKRERNGQLNEDDDDDKLNEDSKDITNDIMKMDKIHNPKKKKKVERRKGMQVRNLNADVSKKEKSETKRKNGSNTETVIKNSKHKVKGTLSSLIKNGTDASEKVKLKKSKTTATNVLNIATPVKIKKSTGLRVCSKWDVSDNVEPSTSSPSVNNNIKSNIVEETITYDLAKNNNTINERAWLVPVLKKLEIEQNKTPVSSKQQYKGKTNSSTKKRVKIALQRNTAQHTSEYMLQIQKSPAIPFDADKKPLAGVLKASPIPSPINPFYKKKF